MEYDFLLGIAIFISKEVTEGFSKAVVRREVVEQGITIGAGEILVVGRGTRLTAILEFLGQLLFGLDDQVGILDAAVVILFPSVVTSDLTELIVDSIFPLTVFV